MFGYVLSRVKTKEQTDMWITTSSELPPDNVVVLTKVHDASGERNVQELKRSGNLWFIPDGSMYVYYAPTHWYKQ